MRTKFPVSWYRENYPPFNKSKLINDKLKGFSHVTRSIDRIQISIRNKGKNFKGILNRFGSEFVFLGTKKAGKRLIVLYEYEGRRVDLVYPPNGQDDTPPFWFSVSLYDPRVKMQQKVLDVLALSGVRKEDVSLSQVEFSVDFYPEDEKDLPELFEALTDDLIVRRSREGFFRNIGTTQYQGLRGTVRKGSRGLRCYPKDKRFVRVELQANRALLKNMGICMPVSPFDIDPFDHAEYRQGLTELTFDKLFEMVYAKRSRSGKPAEEGRLRKRRIKLKSIFVKRTFSCLSCETWGPCRRFEPPDPVALPVVCQIGFFKKVKGEHGLTHQASHFFPKFCN